MKCLACKTKVRKQTAFKIVEGKVIEFTIDVVPEEGMVTACYNCIRLGKFDKDRNIVPLTEMERRVFEQTDPEHYDFLSRMMKLMLQKKQQEQN